MAGIRHGGIGGLSWMVLLLSLAVAAVAAGVLKSAGASGGVLVIIAAAAGAIAIPVGNAVRAQLDQARKDRFATRGLAAGAVEQAVLVRDLSIRDLRVHRAIR